MTMEIRVAVGDTFSADETVPITRTHVALSPQAADVRFAEELLKRGTHCTVPPTVDLSVNIPCSDGHLHEVPEEGKATVKTCNEAYRKLGAAFTFNCTPYLQRNVPTYDKVIAFSESSTTPYVNSMIDTRADRESPQSALCTVITGVAPCYGPLLDENRRGQILVDVQAQVSSDSDYQFSGWCYSGKYRDLEIPVLTETHNRPILEGFMNFGAQLNTSDCVSMYHVVDITPEAPTVEAALEEDRVLGQITITQNDLEETREHLCCKPGKIDLAVLGCPHLTIRQVAITADLIEGRRLAVDTWTLTSSPTHELTDRTGYLSMIQRVDGYIISDTCIDISPCWQPYYDSVGITDSPKRAYYDEIRNITFIIRPLEGFIEAALREEVLT